MLNGQLVKTITEDGLELAGFWTPQKGDLAIFHSHGTAGDFYTHQFIETEAESLTKQKISFLTANNRGQGVFTDIRKHTGDKTDWVQIGAAKERFEDCILDIAAWLNFLESQGIRKVILQSHSLAQKILYYQAVKKDPRVIGQIYLSPCNDAGFMLDLLGKKRYIEVNEMVKDLVSKDKGEALLPTELIAVCQMNALAYFGYLTEDSVGNLFPYHDSKSSKWKMVSEISQPLLVIFGGKDSFIKPSSEQAAKLIKQKAKKAKKLKVEVIKDANHSFIGFEPELVEEIINWVKRLNTKNKWMI